MLRLWRIAFALLACAVVPAKAMAAEPVDLLLVLAADVSRSVDEAKFQLQRDGYASALSDPRVLNVIKSGFNGRIAVSLVEWSGQGSQKVVVDWMLIDSAQAAQQFGDRLLETPRSFADRTSISGGIESAMAQLARAPYTAKRQIIDVSGDGTNNSGRDVKDARDEALKLGITINGLVILSERALPWNPEHTNPPGGLAKYYSDNVTGGPGSFVLEVHDFHTFGEAMTRKLVTEIASRMPNSRLASAP